MSNAVKFTPNGGTIRVSARAEGANAVIEVQDTGEGIDSALLPHVFERFRQGDSSSTRMHGGLGLGLSLVHYLVEAHAGAVNIRSDGRGKGTTVTVRLPLRSSTPVPQPQTRLDSTLAGLRLLVIDDHADSRTLAQVMLESAGAKVTACESVREGMACVQRDDFDLVVADLAIPGEDGFVLIERIRKGGYRMPVIAMTAYSDPERRDRALKAGYDAFLSKPVTTDHLLPLVEKLVGKSADRI
jgi:CheY-like chemotaxis protein